MYNNIHNKRDGLSFHLDMAATTVLNKNEISKKLSPRAAFVHKTLSEDYPGLDYLGMNSVLTAKHRWLIKEYIERPTSTRIVLKSVEKLLLPQVTICPTTPMTVDVARLMFVMRSNPQFRNLENKTMVDFTYFMLAGSGFQKMDMLIARWNESYINFLTAIYDTMRNELDTRTFFYRIFIPAYTIRRGKCFKTVQSLYQTNQDELGKFRLQIRLPKVMDVIPKQDQILLFIGEAKPEIEPYPRYYLYFQQYAKVRLAARQLNLLPGTEHCSNEYANVGTATCYLIKWIVDNLEKPFNCTYPYMDKIRNTSLPSCDAEIIVKNYKKTVNAEGNNIHECILSCKRWQYFVDLDRTLGPSKEDSGGLEDYKFRVDLSYDNLQYEQLSEIYILTAFGLLAQIGGQLSLFLGTSILGLIQVTLMVTILCKRTLKRAFHPDSYEARIGAYNPGLIFPQGETPNNVSYINIQNSRRSSFEPNTKNLSKNEQNRKETLIT
ncbi:unnamed protein product [Dracunculus medinensis]|uniref:Amiloride-sensitive sodium channel n=1 Tax=Dracunculus medinensis TaxID=318479 RepID=A0A0N4UNV8_DRAME|nr:unnamed protein product [Dracunculus medinensis]